MPEIKQSIPTEIIERARAAWERVKESPQDEDPLSEDSGELPPEEIARRRAFEEAKMKQIIEAVKKSSPPNK